MPDGRTVYVVPAQRGDTRTKQPPVRTVVAPDGGNIYVVEEQPKDTRTQRQRCLDEEVAAEGGSTSQLAMGAIDLERKRVGEGKRGKVRVDHEGSSIIEQEKTIRIVKKKSKRIEEKTKYKIEQPI